MVRVRYGGGLHGAWGRLVQTTGRIAGGAAVLSVGSDWHRSWAGLSLADDAYFCERRSHGVRAGQWAGQWAGRWLAGGSLVVLWRSCV